MSNNEWETYAKSLAEQLGIKDFYVLEENANIKDILQEKRQQPIGCLTGGTLRYIVFRNRDSAKGYLILTLYLKRREAELNMDSFGSEARTSIKDIIQFYSGECMADIAEKARRAKKLKFDLKFPDEVLEYNISEKQKNKDSNSITKTLGAHGEGGSEHDL